MIHLDKILDATDHHRDDSHPNVGCHSFPGDGDVLTSTRLDRTPFGVVENIRSGKICVSLCFNIRDVNECRYEEGVLM